MTTFNEGDLVEATKGDTQIRGRITDIDSYFIGESGRTTIALEKEGLSLELIEAAAPKWVAPTEPGSVVRIKGDGNRHWLCWLSNHGDWDVITPRGEVERVANFPADGIVGEIESCEVLEPRSATAKAVLDKVATAWGFGPLDPVKAKLRQIADEFGVTA